MARVPYSRELLLLATAVAHDAWRERMVHHGWGYALAFDATQLRHDALVAFADLRPADRRGAVFGVQTFDLLGTMAAAIDYDRSDNPPLEPEEMRIDMPVTLSEDPPPIPQEAANPPAPAVSTRPSPSPIPSEIGRVIGWTVDTPSGMLTEVVILWPDGSITRHVPLEKELRRVE